MKKKNKLILGGISILLGGLVLTGCTKSFCTVNDQAHIMYMFDYGVTQYIDKSDKVASDIQLFEGNDNIYVRYTALSDMPENSGIGLANAQAASLGAPTPSVNYWASVDNYVLSLALAKTSFSKATITYNELIQTLDDYGYLKFVGTEENDVIFGNLDNVLEQASHGLSIDDCPTKDYVAKYKDALNSIVSSYRACFTIDDGEYGYYGYESGNGFRPQPSTVKLEPKTWRGAWKQGFFQGLLVFPIGWLTETFIKLFGGNNPEALAKGGPQILGLLFVTFIIRGLMLLITFRSTAANSKMQMLQPEITKIQNKYPNSNTNKNEQQRMMMEMQALYRKNKINPLSTLITLVVQFPIFICVWGALQSSASLSTGSFLGLNLSSSISSTIFKGSNWANGSAVTALMLFLLMAGAQVTSMLLPRIFQKKNNAKVAKLGKNPAQKEQQDRTKMFTYIMMGMIIIMGFTLVSAMGVYWFVGALFSIIQTCITQAISNKKKQKKI